MIAAIGGVISLLIVSQMASRWGPVWLVIGVVFLLYVLWGRSFRRDNGMQPCAATRPLRCLKAKWPCSDP